jgi:hypothetical protein
MASNGRMTDERWIENNLEGSGSCLFELLPGYLDEVVEENHGKPQ